MAKSGIGPTARTVTFCYVEALTGDPGSPRLARWTVQVLDEEWEAWVALELRAREGHDHRRELEAVHVEVRSRSGYPSSLKASVYKRLRLSEAVRYGRARAQEPFGLGGGPGPVLQRVRPARHPGRGGHGLDYYAEVSAAYVNAAKSATTGSRGFMDALAMEELGMSGAKALRRTLRRARDLGVLTPAPLGTAGGRLTEVGERALLMRPRDPACDPMHAAQYVDDPDDSDPFWRDRLSNACWRAREGHADSVTR